MLHLLERALDHLRIVQQAISETFKRQYCSKTVYPTNMEKVKEMKEH